MKYWSLLLLMQLFSCQTMAIRSAGNDDTKKWANMYPYPYALEGKFLEAAHNAKWTELDDGYAPLREQVIKVLSEWGLKLQIDPSPDRYLGEYEYKTVPYSYKFYKSEDNSFYLVSVHPEIKFKDESVNGWVKKSIVEAHPIKIILMKKNFEVLSIIKGP